MKVGATVVTRQAAELQGEWGWAVQWVVGEGGRGWWQERRDSVKGAELPSAVCSLLGEVGG